MNKKRLIVAEVVNVFLHCQMESHREATVLILLSSVVKKRRLSYRLGRRPSQQSVHPLVSDLDRIEEWMTGRSNTIAKTPSTSI